MSAKQFADRDFREEFLKRSYHDPSIVDEKVMDEIMLGARSEGYMTASDLAPSIISSMTFSSTIDGS